MSWVSEWKALSAQIEGLLEAARFYIESSGSGQKDVYMVANRQLLPQIKSITTLLSGFRDTYKKAMPPIAAACLDAQLHKVETLFPNLRQADAFAHVHVMVTLLTSFRSEFDYYISDNTAIAKLLSERAFIHLERSIVADPDVRRKWKKAFRSEPACEKLGGVHLLLHGIWAFKINTEGERTDLVLGEPLLDAGSYERAAEALVLTEWKRVKSQAEVEKVATSARRQAARYTTGGLAGIELALYRFIVLVSSDFLTIPADEIEEAITYRHINIAVDPSTPSRTSNRSGSRSQNPR